MHRIDIFLEQFKGWANNQQDIKGVFLVGSRGRDTASPTSDLDIAFITTRPDRYRNPREWLQNFGLVWSAIYMTGESISGLPVSDSVFSALEGGIAIDFLIIPYHKIHLWYHLVRVPYIRNNWLADNVNDSAYLFQQGTKTLLDKDGFIGRWSALMHTIPVKPSQKPSNQDLQMLQDDYYLGIIQMVNYLMRREPIASFLVRERPVRRSLMKLAQWHAQSINQEWNNPLKYRDKKLVRWADSRFTHPLRLSLSFSGYSPIEQWKMIHQSIETFNEVLGEIAIMHNLTLDDKPQAIKRWIDDQYQLWQTAIATDLDRD